MANQVPEFGVSEAVALFNQMFETATPAITVIGEVANFKINQGKWVFFDVKDEESSLGCFLSVFNLRAAVEDGMRVAVTARPTVTKWGKFSLTVLAIRPIGEGAIRRAFELLRAKLDSEGLFAPERKRLLPALPERIGVISSTDAAGYHDFIKILGQRFGGLKLTVAPVQVQGEGAAEQIIYALSYLNEQAEPPEVIAILRGGGSRDDLLAFDDEPLVRAIAASRVPIITGIGHEIDTTLADLAADVRAATPSNAAEILVPDKREIMAGLDARLRNLMTKTENYLVAGETRVVDGCGRILNRLDGAVEKAENKLWNLEALLRQMSPQTVLNRGYAIVRGADGRIFRERPRPGARLELETAKYQMAVKVEQVEGKNLKNVNLNQEKEVRNGKNGKT